MNALKNLRLAAFLEGVSLLVLVLLAMPLKYFWSMPIFVRVVGSIHGLFFVFFCSALYRVVLELGWGKGRALGALIYAFLPGGTFVLDRKLVKEAEQRRAAELR